MESALKHIWSHKDQASHWPGSDAQLQQKGHWSDELQRALPSAPLNPFWTPLT